MTFNNVFRCIKNTPLSEGKTFSPMTPFRSRVEVFARSLIFTPAQTLVPNIYYISQVSMLYIL